MCGIIGVAGWVGHRERQVFTNLLGWDVVRGHHATGVAAIRQRTEEVHILKRAMHAYDFMDLKGYEPTIQDSKVLIGHNRFGTVGGNSHRNAHPFVFDNVVGVHNGTIPYVDKKVLKDHDKFDTDSEAIFYNIGEFGAKAAIKDLKGAWSLVWWDRLEHKLNFLRNKERPMYYTLSETRKELFWASESGMLQAVLARHGVKHGQVFGTAEDTMLSFTIPNDNSAIEAPERTEVKGAAPFVFPGRTYGLGLDDWEEDWTKKDWSNSTRLRSDVSGIEDRKSLSDLRSMGRGQSSQSTPSAERLSEKPNVGVSLAGTHPPPPRLILPAPERGAMSDLAEAIRGRIEADQSAVPFTPGHEFVTSGESVDTSKIIHLKGKMIKPGTGQMSRLVQVYKSFYVDKQEFDKMAKNGCAYCEKQVEFKDIRDKKEEIHWLAKDAFMCDECMDDPGILEYLAGMNIDIPQRKKLN